MKFDIKKLKELNELDYENIAIWPQEIKIFMGVLCASLVAGLCYYFIVSSKLPELDGIREKEIDLRQNFEAKYRVAVNLDAYKAQLARIEDDFSSMLKSLPTSNETPGLLDDITFVGTDAGLSFKLLNWQQENPKEFYTELPIQIEVLGSYHEFGQFASHVANLPRIVTLHNFDMDIQNDTLSLKMQAKTYRAETSEHD